MVQTFSITSVEMSIDILRCIDITEKNRPLIVELDSLLKEIQLSSSDGYTMLDDSDVNKRIISELAFLLGKYIYHNAFSYNSVKFVATGLAVRNFKGSSTRELSWRDFSLDQLILFATNCSDGTKSAFEITVPRSAPPSGTSGGARRRRRRSTHKRHRKHRRQSRRYRK